MSSAVTFAIFAAVMAGNVMEIVVNHNRPKGEWTPIGSFVIAPACIAQAITDMLEGQSVSMTIFTVLAGLHLWIIWRWWTRRRKGKPSRVLGLVRNLGHRLVVVPVAGGAK